MSDARKINTGRKGAQLFVGIWVQQGMFQLNVTRIAILVKLVGTVGVFSAPSMLVFASLHVRRKEIKTEGKGHNFLSEYGYSM